MGTRETPIELYSFGSIVKFLTKVEEAALEKSVGGQGFVERSKSRLMGFCARQALKRVIFGPGTYLVPREDGLIVVGATSEREAGFTEGLTPDGQKQLQRGITSLLPMAANWPPMERWWGFRPCTPDEGPLLGACTIKGLWLACGHHRNGVLMAAATSEMISDLVEGSRPSEEQQELLEEFSWKRFKNLTQVTRESKRAGQIQSNQNRKQI